jgi:hypothetical protein
VESWIDIEANMKSILILLSIVALTACKTATVETPIVNSVHTTSPDITISFSGGKPDPFVVELNGKDISSHFVVSLDGAVASGEDVKEFLKDGKNSLKVTKPNTPIRFFTYDISGPVVHILSTVENQDNSLTVTGYVDDPSGVHSLMINGSNVSLDNNSFVKTVFTDNNAITFGAIDNNGYVSEKVYVRPRTEIDNAIKMRIGRSGLDFIVSEMNTLLTDRTKLDPIIAQMNPVKQDCLLGSCYYLNVNWVSIGRAAMNMDIIGSEGDFSLLGTMNSIVADFAVDLKPLIGWDSTITGKFYLDAVDFQAIASSSIDGGKVVFDITVPYLDLDRIRTDVNNFPDWLLTPIYEVFEWLFELIVRGQIEDISKEKLEEFVNTFPNEFYLSINGNEIKPLVIPQSIASPDNGIDISLGANVTALTSNGPAQLGYAYKASAQAPTPTLVSPDGVSHDVGIVVDVNVINQAMVAATESGLLSISLTPADIAGIGAISETASNIRVRIAPASAPEIKLIDSKSEGLGTLILNDFYMAFDVMLPNTSTWQTLLGAKIDMNASADFLITPTKAIAVDLKGMPEVLIREIDSDSLILERALAQTMLDQFTPVILPPVMKAIGGIPLPSFEGYTVNMGDFWVMDADAGYVGITADLTKVE